MMTGREREIGDSFEFGSGQILRYCNIGVQNIIFDFEITIYEQISVEKTCRMGVSTSWN